MDDVKNMYIHNDKIRWECIHFIENVNVANLVFSNENQTILSIDMVDARNKNDVLMLFNNSLKFPYFGNNWDALSDCLHDLSWMPADGYGIVLTNSTNLMREDPLSVGKLISIWLCAAQHWAKYDKPFNLVIML